MGKESAPAPGGFDTGFACDVERDMGRYQRLSVAECASSDGLPVRLVVYRDRVSGNLGDVIAEYGETGYETRLPTFALKFLGLGSVEHGVLVLGRFIACMSCADVGPNRNPLYDEYFSDGWDGLEGLAQEEREFAADPEKYRRPEGPLRSF